MSLSGQISTLSQEIKDLLVDGLEATGLVCTDNAPAFSGTGPGEDFDGLSIYATSINDLQDDKHIKRIPCIEFRGDKMPVNYFLDAEVEYQGDFVFEISLPLQHSKIIDSTIHKYNALMNWYLERLEYVLDIWTPQIVMHTGKQNTGGMNMGRTSNESDAIYFGQSFLSISFISEGGSI